MKTSSTPARMPGAASGSVTRQNACHSRAPRSAAASSRCGSCRSSAAYSGSTMKGRCAYTSPSTTAPQLYSSGSGSLVSPARNRIVLTSPVSRSRNIQA